MGGGGVVLCGGPSCWLLSARTYLSDWICPCAWIRLWSWCWCGARNCISINSLRINYWVVLFSSSLALTLLLACIQVITQTKNSPFVLHHFLAHESIHGDKVSPPDPLTISPTLACLKIRMKPTRWRKIPPFFPLVGKFGAHLAHTPCPSLCQREWPINRWPYTKWTIKPSIMNQQLLEIISKTFSAFYSSWSLCFRLCRLLERINSLRLELC